MRHTLILVLIAHMLALSSLGCSTTTIRTDWDSEVDFATYSTVAPAPDGRRPAPRHPSMSPLVRDRIDRAVLSELAAKGWRSTAPGRADLIVITHTAVHQKVQVVHTGYAGPRRWHYGWGWGTTSVHRYREGSLVVDLVDRRRKALVWRGVAEGAFSSSTPSDAVVADIVARVLADFPPTL